MTLKPDDACLIVNQLRKEPREAEWFEFKVGNTDPAEIGEQISAIGNSAALVGREFGYVAWGIEDATHAVVGTTFNPKATKIGNEELESWLSRLLTPKPYFEFTTVEMEGKPVVLLRISRANREPIQFKGQDFIRVGSYTKKLKDFPAKEGALWRAFDATPFEQQLALEGIATAEVVRLLDHEAYFALTGRPAPVEPNQIVEDLSKDELVRRMDSGLWGISNLGAILFSRRLEDFPRLRRKAMRVIQYRGRDRSDAVNELSGKRGYAGGFKGLIQYINALLPSNEVIEAALRKTVPVYPTLAVRELVANALIHQDFSISGSGPTIEIFADRMEITNPGVPLVDTDRFLDSPPRSRNETLASLMRRAGVCEERGSGVDKIVFQTELFQLPAPLFEATEGSTRAILFSPVPLNSMDRADRIRACYLHASLKRVGGAYLTNASLRERFRIERKNIAKTSRLIREAVEAGRIVPFDAEGAPKFMKYLPWWASHPTSPT